MKLTDNLIKKYGVDKLLHHAFGGLLCAFISVIAILQDGTLNWSAVAYPTIGSALVFVLSIIKEYIDTEFNWKDILAAMLGCLWVYLAVFIGIAFYQLSM